MHRLASWLAALWLALSALTGPALASQAPLVTPGAPLPMTALASFLNAAFQSIGSCNSGNAAPANGAGGAAFAYECWWDTSANPAKLKVTVDGGTHWTILGTVDTLSTYLWAPYFGTNPTTPTPPIVTSVSSGVLTIALQYDSNFTNNGSNQLAFAPIAAGSLLANSTGSSAEPTATTPSAWLNQWCSGTQYNFPQRGASSWACGTISGLLIQGTGIVLSGTGQVTVSLATPVTVPNGGTGQTALAANAFLLGSGTGAINPLAISGLVLGNGASAPTSYAGTGCTSQVVTALSAAGVATCNTISSSYLATIAGYSLFGNTGSATASPTGFTIGGLTQKASPASTDYIMIQDQAAAGALKYATVGSVASAGSVASVNGATGAVSLVTGYANKFRNGTFDVWQRGTSALSTTSGGAYTADGWIVAQTGAQGSCTQDTGNNGALFSLKCVGVASNTDTTFAQRIESYDAAALAGQTVTVQFQYKQDTGSAVTPKISTCYASATDNFGTCTADLASTSLTSCASGSWCTEAYTLSVSANASKGYQVTLDCNTALSGAQHCWMTAADVRITPNITTGVNSNPPPPELRSVQSELAQSQRFYLSVTNYFLGLAQGTYNLYSGELIFPTPMRTAPSMVSCTFTSNAGSAGTCALNNQPATNITALWASLYNSLGNWTATATIEASATFSAEL